MKTLVSLLLVLLLPVFLGTVVAEEWKNFELVELSLEVPQSFKSVEGSHHSCSDKTMDVRYRLRVLGKSQFEQLIEIAEEALKKWNPDETVSQPLLVNSKVGKGGLFHIGRRDGSRCVKLHTELRFDGDYSLDVEVSYRGKADLEKATKILNSVRFEKKKFKLRKVQALPSPGRSRDTILGLISDVQLAVLEDAKFEDIDSAVDVSIRYIAPGKHYQVKSLAEAIKLAGFVPDRRFNEKCPNFEQSSGIVMWKYADFTRAFGISWDKANKPRMFWLIAKAYQSKPTSSEE